MNTDMIAELTEEIIGGRRLRRGDPEAEKLAEAEADALFEGADRIREALTGKRINLCTIINGRSGRCSEDCKYCAQSAHSRTNCEEYDFLDEDAIAKAAKANEEAGVSRFSVVTSGRRLSGEEFEKALRSFEKMAKECRVELCASLGLLDREQFRRLRKSGVGRYHCNIESSRGFFPQICTTHSFDQKLETIQNAMLEGLSVCSGGIIGMGESMGDRIDMAFTLSELGISSIPLNILIPVKGTPLQEQEPLPGEEILRTVALFRFINPGADIRLAGGRSLLADNGKKAFRCGANAAITGNMLTTVGSGASADRRMLREMGFDVTPEWQTQLNSPCACGKSGQSRRF